MILDGYSVAEQIKQGVKKEIDILKKKNIFPKLAIIQVGNNTSSSIYIRNKRKTCEEVGILLDVITFDENTTERELLNKINELNEDERIHGILVQSPLPNQIVESHIFGAIDYRKDVDGFTPYNVFHLWSNNNFLVPCTSSGIIRLLKSYNIPIEGKHVVIVGRSNIVGKPLALLFLQENATVSILHSKSQNKEEIMKQADILVSAVGKPNFITMNMIKDSAIVIDVGINYVNHKIVGDVDFENVKDKVSYISPVPKGIGPMTIAMLLENVVKATKELNKEK